MSGKPSGVAARVVARRTGLAPVDLVRPVAVAQPELLVRLRVPLQRALGAVGLEPDPVLAAGAHLGDDERAARAVLEAQQHVREVLARRSRARRARRPRRRPENVSTGPVGTRRTRWTVARSANTLATRFPVTKRGEVEPVRADVGDRAELAALLRVEAPVPVGVLEQPVLDVAAVDVEDTAELAAEDALARRDGTGRRSGCCSSCSGRGRSRPRAARAQRSPATSARAASRRRRACPPPARPSPAGSGGGSAS